MVLRSLSVLALAAVSGLAGFTVVSEEDDDARVPVGAPSAITPVLSARRVPGLLAAPVADRIVGAALDELLSRQPGTACLTVSSAGRPIYADDPTLPLVPASAQKLLTAVAVLETLGPDFRFRTALVAAAAPEGGVVAGDAWLVGGGDPLLATAAYAARFRNQPQVVTPIEQLAAALADAGVVSITGTLFGDGSRYDADRYPDAWPQRFIDQDQSGPLSALTINDGWEAFPPDFEATVPDEAPAADPDAHAAGVLAGVLGERGITAGATGTAAAPADAVELAFVDSPPLSEVVGQMLRESDNQTAELLLKELALSQGRAPTSADGAALALEIVTGLGLPMGGVVVADGAGLAPDNLVSCALVQAILERSGPDSAVGNGLPVAGLTGTLSRRFLESAVTGILRAKTGTLNQVTALAGFVDTPPGATLTFSYIVNLVAPDVVDADDLALQDELAAILVRYPEGPALEELAPQPVPVVDGG